MSSPMDKRFLQNVTFAYDQKYKREVQQKITDFMNEMAQMQYLGEPDSLMSFNAQALFFDCIDDTEAEE